MGAKQSVPALQLPAIGIPEELLELHFLCLPMREGHEQALRKRPVRRLGPGYDTMINISTQDWIQMLRIIQKAVNRNPTLSLDWFKRKPFISNLLPDVFLRVPPPRHFLFASTAAVLLDQIWTSASGNAAQHKRGNASSRSDPGYGLHGPYRFIHGVFKIVVEHMLLVDYGFGPHPLKLSDLSYIKDCQLNIVLPQFFAFCRELGEFAEKCRAGPFPSQQVCKDYLHPFALPIWSAQCYANAALMCHWFYTRRQDINLTQYTRGLTGYTGVIPEMIRELPITGPGRLRRKLLFDIYVAIPEYVDHSRGGCCSEQLIQAAQRLAFQYGILPEEPDRPSGPSGVLHHTRCAKCVDVLNVQSAGGPVGVEGGIAPPSYKEAMGE